MKQYSDSICNFVVFFFIIIFIGCPCASFAQRRIEIPSSPNPVGSGARALGMGGAFIAVADDATAASWNPAGLSQLDLPEISFVGDFIHRIEDNSFGTDPEASGPQTIDKTGLNYFSASYPFSLWGRNMVLSLNCQHLYDFTRKWNLSWEYDSEGDVVDEHVDYQQDGRLSALGIAYSIEATPQLSLGFTLNIWDDGLTENEWEQKTSSWGYKTSGSTIDPIGYRSYEKYSFSGINANFGIMWKSDNEKITVGAVLKTPFEADISREYSHKEIQPGSYEPDPNAGAEDSTMDMPMSFGVGFAYRFSDAFTASLDFYRTEWDDFVLTNAKGEEKSPITGKPPAESDIDPTHQVRMGAEYLFISSKYVIPFRWGVFYDPAPAMSGPDDYFGFSIGSGLAIDFSKNKKFFVKGLAFDVAYQYRFGKDVGASILKEVEFSQDVEEHTVYSSVIVHF